ncbi:PIN domain nuclease [Dyadobacter luteus]|uniref:PIN domain nuclease n=1 Tax=Dyadobacter luteus TaxID=2259619 RepID=A0A3D8Y3Y4_9BACT|nr:PIN domain nuclease [Dyadobacter luteus]REA55688.1 PIN domain nuclease [Dyadobacter luteus]
MYRIFDTTIWIDYFHGIINPKTDLLANSLRNDSVCMVGVIVQEVLQGIKNDAMYHRIKGHIEHLPLLPAPDFNTYDSAAQLYRSLRKKGLTIRKPNDCLIAYYAIHFDLELCHNDSDFNIIASGSQLKIWKPF